VDLQAELERAIPDGPPLPPAHLRTAAGRAALRRRRAVQGLAAAGAVAAIVVPVALASGVPVTRGADPAPPATNPSASATDPAPPDRDRSPRPPRDPAADYAWADGEVVAVDLLRGGGLLVRPGAKVLERYPDLYPGKDTESVALVLRYRGLEYWEAWEWDEGGASGISGSPRDPFYADFDDFLAKATSSGGMTGGRPSRSEDAGAADVVTPTQPGVTWTGDALRAEPGTRIIEQRIDPDLPPAFAAPGATTAAAYVERGGVRSLVLYRGDGTGEPQLISVASAGHGGSLDQLLDWARGRYRSGEGLL